MVNIIDMVGDELSIHSRGTEQKVWLSNRSICCVVQRKITIEPPDQDVQM